MIKTTYTIMKNFWLASLLACLVALPLSFAGTSSAFATVLHTNAPPPAPPPNNCLYEGAFMQDDGANKILSEGSTFSACGTNGIVANVDQEIQVTNGCEGTLGTKSYTAYDNFQIPFHDTDSADYTFGAGCVTCEYSHHILTGKLYPDFTMCLGVSTPVSLLRYA